MVRVQADQTLGDQIGQLPVQRSARLLRLAQYVGKAHRLARRRDDVEHGHRLAQRPAVGRRRPAIVVRKYPLRFGRHLFPFSLDIH